MPASQRRSVTPAPRSCYQRCPSIRTGDSMKRPILRRSRLIASLLALSATAGIIASQVALAPASHADDRPGAARGLGQLSGLLPRDHLTLESAIQVDLSRETVRLPLYPGKANGKNVWFVLLDA